MISPLIVLDYAYLISIDLSLSQDDTKTSLLIPAQAGIQSYYSAIATACSKLTETIRDTPASFIVTPNKLSHEEIVNLL